MRNYVSELANFVYFFKEAELNVDSKLKDILIGLANDLDYKTIDSVTLMRLTKVYFNESGLQLDELIKTHIELMTDLPYDESITKLIISKAPQELQV